MWASKQLDSVKAQAQNMDQKIGVEIIQRACSTPLRTIANNAGFEGSVIVGELMKKDQPSQGFNAATGEYMDMIQGGVIDPTKVSPKWVGIRTTM